jgi:hypothetical protein
VAAPDSEGLLGLAIGGTTVSLPYAWREGVSFCVGQQIRSSLTISSITADVASSEFAEFSSFAASLERFRDQATGDIQLVLDDLCTSFLMVCSFGGHFRFRSSSDRKWVVRHTWSNQSSD